MSEKFRLLFTLLFISSFVGAQSNLYIPRNIQKSYENGFRSPDGNPGPDYWQNHSDYQIKAEVFPDESVLKGTEIIKYYNDSPDTLKSMVIRLYGDIFKVGAARDFYGGSADVTNGVEIDYIIIGTDTLEFGKNAYRGSTNIMAKLKSSIAPGSNVEVHAKWTIEIPDTAHLRMGNYRNDNLYIAYWYPQIAVYDDIDGWDRIDYTGLAEFYNDFNNYDIEITVPDDFVVWAAGEIQNADEVFNQKIISRISEAKNSDDLVRIITAKDYAANDVTIKKNTTGKNVWKYSADKITEFSFFTCKNYNWDGTSVEVEPGRRVFCTAAYPDSTIHWDSAAVYARATIEYMSKELPGVPYPYPHTTSFCNGERGGGMESPMLANDGAPSRKSSLIGLVFHEIAHTYLPFYMGINERKYAWMDEGWASFFPGVVVDRLSPESDYYARQARSFAYGAGGEREMPLMTPTYSLPVSTSRYASYARPANAYMELQRMLGNDLFKKSMKEYMNRWHEKHPIPYDYFYSIENVVGEDLDWFWEPWFFERGYPDLALESPSVNGNDYTVKVVNKGTLPVTIQLTFIAEDGSENVVTENSRVWKDKNEYQANFTSEKKIKSVKLGSKHIPDVDKSNNEIEF